MEPGVPWVHFPRGSYLFVFLLHVYHPSLGPFDLFNVGLLMATWRRRCDTVWKCLDSYLFEGRGWRGSKIVVYADYSHPVRVRMVSRCVTVMR
jgi:hypothetical protein